MERWVGRGSSKALLASHLDYRPPCFPLGVCKMDYAQVFANYTQLTSEPNASNEVAAYCPLHDDRRPSLSFNAETGLWYCFACQQGGSAAQFVARVRGCSLAEAEAEIRSYLQEPLDIKGWQKTLKKSPTALGWLQSRGLLDWRVLRKHKVGFEARSLRITIPVHDLQGNLCNVRRISVRANGANTAKVVNWPGCGHPPRLWPIESLRGEGALWLCEGETDCLSALCQGLRAVTSTHGAGTWDESWTELFHKQDVVIAYDPDPEGREGARRVAGALRGVALRVRFAQLPADKDLNDLHREGVVLGELPLEEPDTRDDVEILLDGLPPDLEMAERFNWMQKVAEGIARKAHASWDLYIDTARKRLGVSATVLRKAVERAAEGAVAPGGIPQPLAEPPLQAKSVAQDYDFRSGVGWYGVWLPTSGEDDVFRLVTTDRRLVEAPKGMLLPTQSLRWSIDSATLFNVFSWLNGQAPDVDSRELYDDLVALFQEYMWFPDPTTPHVLAAWTMATYVFQTFDTCGYLLLSGTKRCGKSRLLELLEQLAFAAAKSGTMSAAMLYRSIELDRTVMLFDESDILGAKDADQITDRLAVVLDGYRRFGKAGRIEGETMTPRWYSTYSPKAFASIYTLPDTVIDRAIMIRMLRRPSSYRVADLVFGQQQQRFQTLRNRLYCWGLANMSRLIGRVSQENTGIRDREFEVWQAVLAIGALVGDLDRLVEAAKASAKAKITSEGESSMTAAVIQACALLLYEDPCYEDPLGKRWYRRTRIRERVAKILEREVEDITPERLRSEMSKAGLLQEGGSRQFRHGALRGQRGYTLDAELVLQAADRFEVEQVGPDILCPTEAQANRSMEHAAREEQAFEGGVGL